MRQVTKLQNSLMKQIESLSTKGIAADFKGFACFGRLKGWGARVEAITTWTQQVGVPCSDTSFGKPCFPQLYRRQSTTIRIMGTPQKGTPNLEMPVGGVISKDFVLGQGTKQQLQRRVLT